MPTYGRNTDGDGPMAELGHDPNVTQTPAPGKARAERPAPAER